MNGRFVVQMTYYSGLLCKHERCTFYYLINWGYPHFFTWRREGSVLAFFVCTLGLSQNPMSWALGSQLPITTFYWRKPKQNVEIKNLFRKFYFVVKKDLFLVCLKISLCCLIWSELEWTFVVKISVNLSSYFSTYNCIVNQCCIGRANSQHFQGY